MKSSLIKKIGIPLLFGGLSLINIACSSNEEYLIDNKAVYDDTEVNFLRKHKWGGNLIITDKYIFINKKKIESFSTPVEIYRLSNKTHEDSIVIQEAQKKVDYYLHYTDSTKKVNRIKEGLDALK